MKEWSYVGDTPFIPVKLIGKEFSILRLALVDTGAKYCVLHEKIAEKLNLDKVDIGYMIGFGSKRKFPVDICILSVEINGITENVLAASIKEKIFPEAAPRIVIGRNLLNKFKITLDGRSKKISLE